GDGIPDVAVVNGGGASTVSVLLGNGKGTFQPRAAFAAGPSPSRLTGGDFNGDGLLDVALANPSSNTLSVLLNAAGPPPPAGGTPGLSRARPPPPSRGGPPPG